MAKFTRLLLISSSENTTSQTYSRYNIVKKRKTKNISIGVSLVK